MGYTCQYFLWNVDSNVLVLKKNRDRDDVLFIDASGNFEKQKTQNVLLPAHIDAIVDAYAGRGAMAKFAHVAKRLDIRANDFNLNIPRYVDTFEAEAAIDLDAVARELGELAVASAATDETNGRFVMSLGLCRLGVQNDYLNYAFLNLKMNG